MCKFHKPFWDVLFWPRPPLGEEQRCTGGHLSVDAIKKEQVTKGQLKNHQDILSNTLLSIHRHLVYICRNCQLYKLLGDIFWNCMHYQSIHPMDKKPSTEPSFSFWIWQCKKVTYCRKIFVFNSNKGFYLVYFYFYCRYNKKNPLKFLHKSLSFNFVHHINHFFPFFL